MKLKNILMTGVLVATLSSSSVAFAATAPTKTAHPSTTRSENNVRRVKTDLLNTFSALLNVSQADLLNKLESGQSISDIASESGVSKAYLISKLLENEKKVLDLEVLKGTLSLEKESHILYKATSRLSTLLDRSDVLDTPLFQKKAAELSNKEVETLFKLG